MSQQTDDHTLSSDEFDDFLDERLQDTDHDHDDEEFERLLNEAEGEREESIHAGNGDDAIGDIGGDDHAIGDTNGDDDENIEEEKGGDQLTQQTDGEQEKTGGNDGDIDDDDSDEIVVVDFHHGEEEEIIDECMMRSHEGERHILVQEVVDARVSTFISSLLNRFGKIVRFVRGLAFIVMI